MTPPLRFFIFEPGLLISKDLKTCITVFLDSSLSGVSIVSSIAPINASTLRDDCADTGIIGESACFVPLTNLVISEKFDKASWYDIKSTLF